MNIPTIDLAGLLKNGQLKPIAEVAETRLGRSPHPATS